MTRLYTFRNEDRIGTSRWNAEIDALYTKLASLTTTMTEYTVGATVASTVDDEAYGAGWNGTTDESPSLDNLYDELELRAEKASPTFTGTVTLPSTTPSASTEATHPDYLVDLAQTKIDAATLTDPTPNTSSTDAVSTSFVKDYLFAPIFYERDTSAGGTVTTTGFGTIHTTGTFTMPYNGDVLILIAFANDANGVSISAATTDIHYRVEVRKDSATIRAVQHEFVDVSEGNAFAQWAVLRDLTKDDTYTVRLTGRSTSSSPTVNDPAVLVLGLPSTDTVTRVDTPDVA